MCNKQNKNRKPYTIYDMTRQERLSMVYELNHYERYGRFSFIDAKKKRLLRVMVRLREEHPSRYKYLKKKLVNAIMNDIKMETNNDV